MLTADAHIQNTIKTLAAMKDGNGVSLSDFTDQFNCSGTFHGVLLSVPSDADRQRFANYKAFPRTGRQLIFSIHLC